MWVKSLSVFGVVLGLTLIEMDGNGVTAQHCLVCSIIKVADNVGKRARIVCQDCLATISKISKKCICLSWERSGGEGLYKGTHIYDD